MADTVSFRSPRGAIEYRDSRDHFENGLLRLLRLDVATFQRWLDLAELEGAADPLEGLGRTFQRLRPIPVADGANAGAIEAGPGGEPGELWHARLAESPDWGVARARDGSLAWLVRADGADWRRERQPPAYEEAYFEGDALTAGGYGDYEAQAAWRSEKAQRQVRELQAIAPLPPGGRALDVGSGYGFFRRALGDAGFPHDGIEISAHARAVARRLYGFETDAGPLSARVADWRSRFDLVTLWDVIEHVDDPRAFLADVAACLHPGGFAVLKTPNIDCPEAEMFGPHYHSLKREHLVYFGAAGLLRAARAAGLEPVHTTSRSHLLVGFVGAEQTARWASTLRGADLTVVLRKAPASALRDGTEPV